LDASSKHTRISVEIGMLGQGLISAKQLTSRLELAQIKWIKHFLSPRNTMSGSDTTKVLLSFAMANHGANFAIWLRDRLMKSYNFYSVKAVYVDSVVSRSGDTIHSMGSAKIVNGGTANQTIVENKNPAPFPKPASGVATVTPDIRAHMKSQTGAISIGAMRDDWNVLYKTAMSQAKVMLFVYTSEYNNSIWCMKEWGQFHMENGLRRKRNQAPLRGVLLEFTDGGNLIGINQTNVTRLTVSKLDGGCKDLAWDKGDFILSDSDMKKLTNAIGSL